MELRPILSPEYQSHQQLIGSTQFGRPAKVSRTFFNHSQHRFKGFGLYTGQSFKVTLF